MAIPACRRNQEELAWTSIDVNIPTIQADAHLLTVGRANHVLIDTGSRHTADKFIRFLRDKNCRHIQTVIITHGHSDHYGGLVPLIQSETTLGEVYFNPPPDSLVTNEPWGCSPADFEEIRKELRKKNIPLKKIEPKSRWILGKAALQTICAYDGLNTPVGRTDINDTSVIIMLTHGKIKILFAADLNGAIGHYLTTNCPGLLKADILKFPHHGTEGFPGDAFWTAVGARAFVVPAPEELWLCPRSERARRLTEGKPTYVNGRDGDITIVSDGNAFKVVCGK